MKRLFLTLMPIALGGCAIVTLGTMKRSWPDDEGPLEAPGPDEQIQVLFDDHGIPHVRAQNESDAWYALGFLHARDRLFQADMLRRVAYGRLSEWYGEDTAELDAFTGSLGLRDRTAQALADVPPEVKASIDAYTKGMNAGAASLDALPVEYRLLHLKFEPWTAEDCGAAAWLNALGLSTNLSTEIAGVELRDVDVDLADALFRADPNSPPVDPGYARIQGGTIGPWLPGFQEVWGIPAPAASNNWAVAGSHSADGKPIVANDPHLMQGVPSLWYAVDLRGGPLAVTGVSLPGAPAVVLGHTDSVAWAFTNVMADTIDLAVMDRRGDSYVLDGQERPFEHVEVRFPVRGKGIVVRDALWTDAGPLLTSIDGDRVVALQWSALSPDGVSIPNPDEVGGADFLDETFELMWDLDHAESVDDAIAAVSRPSMIAQNLVAGDADHIGWYAFGSWPERTGYTGRLPRLASDPGVSWSGFAADHPTERDPERGFIVTANSPPDDPHAYAISTAYVPPFRKARIAELLERYGDIDPTGIQVVQVDRYDAHAAKVVTERIRADLAVAADAEPCKAALLAWDFDATPESAGAAVFYPFERALARRLVSHRLPADRVDTWMWAASPGDSVVDGRIDAFTTDLDGDVAGALSDACGELQTSLGPDPAAWRWGDLHQLALEHPFGARSKALTGWNRPVTPYGGSDHTVNAAGISWSGGWGVRQIASMRLIQPLSDLNASLFVHPGGQSGHPKNPWSDDLYGAFVAGEAVHLWSRDEDVRAHLDHELILVPGDGRGNGAVQQSVAQ